MNKNLLICVSGLTPQIITETLYCLSVQKKTKIDELYVITTSRGREVIMGVDDKIKLPPFIVELKKMCISYKINLPKFEYNDSHVIVAKEQSIEMKDVRNDKQNKLFPNKLCEFINQKSKDKNNILYCSIEDIESLSSRIKRWNLYHSTTGCFFLHLNNSLLFIH